MLGRRPMSAEVGVGSKCVLHVYQPEYLADHTRYTEVRTTNRRMALRVYEIAEELQPENLQFREFLWAGELAPASTVCFRNSMN